MVTTAALLSGQLTGPSGADSVAQAATAVDVITIRSPFVAVAAR